MKKSKLLIKGILLTVLSVSLIGTAGVYAADSVDDEIDELTKNFSTDSKDTTTTSDKDTNNTNTNTNTNTNKSNSNANVANNNTNKSNTNNTNSSVYNNTTNNTNLPKTGAEDTLPMMVLVVVFGISSVYAYKKIKEYKNV